MFESMWNFIKRHRTHIVVSGIVVVGGTFIARYAKRKLHDYQQQKMTECFSEIRRQHHFDSNQRNYNATVISLLPRLRDVICQTLDSEELTAKLKQRPPNKVEIWDQLKIISFTRSLVAVYACTLLTIFLRVQLNVIGGYLYLSKLSSHTDSVAQTSSEVQKQYLAHIQYLFDRGLADLISVVEGAVRKVLGAMTLTSAVSADTLFSIVRQIRDIVEACPASSSDNLQASSLCRYVAPSLDSNVYEGSSLSEDLSMLTQLDMETRDLLNSADFNLVLRQCLDATFSNLAVQVLALYPSASPNIHSSSGSIPLAKVIPIIDGFVHSILADLPNTFVQGLLLNEQAKVFAVNIYDAFCQPLITSC